MVSYDVIIRSTYMAVFIFVFCINLIKIHIPHGMRTLAHSSEKTKQKTTHKRAEEASSSHQACIFFLPFLERKEIN
jgi:hypothetical protein